MNADEALVKLRADPRDQEAWTVFYLHTHAQLLAYVSGLLFTFGIGSVELAQDVVHDVLVMFLTKWVQVGQKLSSVSDAEAYLKRSCRNLLVDRYRHDRTAQSFVHFAGIRFGEVFGSEREIYRRLVVDEIIGLLPQSCAAMLKTYVEQDLTPAELAEHENLSIPAFYSRWYRCIERAREKLGAKKTPG